MMAGPGKGVLQRQFARSARKSVSFLSGPPEIVRYIVEIVFQRVRIPGHSKENSAIDQEKEILLASVALILGVRAEVQDPVREVHFLKDEKNVLNCRYP